jgi:protein-disulfide isomerase
MNRFYLLLALVAVVAGVLIWKSSQSETAGALPSQGATVPVTAADSAFRGYTTGSDSAPVEVVEYADFQCPHCAEFAVVQFPTIRDQLIQSGKLRWRFRDFPLGFPWSRVSALAAQCAGEQGKFWEMSDALFQRQSDWGRSTKSPTGLFRDLARAAGADVAKYDACMDSQRYAGRIEAGHQEGLARNINGTPTFFVNGRLYDFPRGATSDAFQALVDSISGTRR